MRALIAVFTALGCPAHADYLLPLDPTGQSLTFQNASVDYAWTADSKFRLGPLSLDDNAITARLKPDAPTITLAWDPKWIQPDRIEIIGRLGKSLQLVAFDGTSKTSSFDFPLDSVKEGGAEAEALRGKFRLCLVKEKAPSFANLCTGFFRLERGDDGKPRLLPSREEKRLLINNAPVAAEAGDIDLHSVQALVLFVRLDSGLSYQIVGTFIVPSIYTYAKTSAETVTFLTSPFEPFGLKTRPVDLEPDPRWARVIGFSSTIRDSRDMVQFSLPLKSPRFFVKTSVGAAVLLKPTSVRWPETAERVSAPVRPRNRAYGSERVVVLRAPENTTLTTTDGTVTPLGGGSFRWTVPLPEKGELNVAKVSVETGALKYAANLRTERGFPGEASVRLSAFLLPSGSSAALREFAWNHWFDELFGWDNPRFSTLRWGVALKYLQSMSDVTVDRGFRGEEKVDTSSANIDLKYRFSSGIWGRDETVGLLLSGQRFEIGEVNSQQYGAGLFWARSMPLVFDRLFNYVPGLEFQKWVDMEFIYFPVATGGNAKTWGPNYLLNFHGRILWTKTFFGEAGFGIKSYRLESSELNQRVGFDAFYGTFGLGFTY